MGFGGMAFVWALAHLNRSLTGLPAFKVTCIVSSCIHGIGIHLQSGSQINDLIDSLIDLTSLMI